MENIFTGIDLHSWKYIVVIKVDDRPLGNDECIFIKVSANWTFKYIHLFFFFFFLTMTLWLVRSDSLNSRHASLSFCALFLLNICAFFNFWSITLNLFVP